MIHYEERRGVAISWALGGVLSGLIWGSLTRSAWTTFLSGSLDWSVGELLLFSLGMVVPGILLLAGCTRCLAITAQEDGMTVKTCIFVRFFIPWQDVTGLWGYRSRSAPGMRHIRKNVITIKRGLTPVHRSLPRRGPKGWQWPRGFQITSEAQGYSDLVRAIEARVGEEQDLRTFYKPSE